MRLWGAFRSEMFCFVCSYNSFRVRAVKGGPSSAASECIHAVVLWPEREHTLCFVQNMGVILNFFKESLLMLTQQL